LLGTLLAAPPPLAGGRHGFVKALRLFVTFLGPGGGPARPLPEPSAAKTTNSRFGAMFGLVRVVAVRRGLLPGVINDDL